MSKCTPTNRVNQHLARPMGELDALVGQFFGSPVFGAAAQCARPAWRTPASVWQADGHLCVSLDVPGVASEDIDVTVDDGQLAIQVKRSDEEGREYLYNERGFGELTRSMDLPDTVDPESVTAEVTNGVLTVSIAQRPETQPRKIDVRQG